MFRVTLGRTFRLDHRLQPRPDIPGAAGVEIRRDPPAEQDGLDGQVHQGSQLVLEGDPVSPNTHRGPQTPLGRLRAVNDGVRLPVTGCLDCHVGGVGLVLVTVAAVPPGTDDRHTQVAQEHGLAHAERRDLAARAHFGCELGRGSGRAAGQTHQRGHERESEHHGGSTSRWRSLAEYVRLPFAAPLPALLRHS